MDVTAGSTGSSESELCRMTGGPLHSARTCIVDLEVSNFTATLTALWIHAWSLCHGDVLAALNLTLCLGLWASMVAWMALPLLGQCVS